MERIYHTWDKWECYPAGFYAERAPKGMTNEDCEEAYRAFLADLGRFGVGMMRVLDEWKNSCEHYLTNNSMNRIAWMGQSAMCIETGIPARYRGGYNLLTDEQKEAADRLALEYINIWMERQGYPLLTDETVKSRTQANLY